MCTFYIFFQKTSFCVQTFCIFLSVFVFNSISSLKTFQDLCNDWFSMYLMLCFLKLKKSSVILFSVYINYFEYIKTVLWKHTFRKHVVKHFILDYQNIKVIEKVLRGMWYENFEYSINWVLEYCTGTVKIKIKYIFFHVRFIHGIWKKRWINNKHFLRTMTSSYHMKKKIIEANMWLLINSDAFSNFWHIKCFLQSVYAT